jgi:tRNA A-37 threonylcarbamoyl transferase component Bud32
MRLDPKNASPTELLGLAELLVSLENTEAPYDTAEVTQIYKIAGKIAVARIRTETGKQYVAKHFPLSDAATLIERQKHLTSDATHTFRDKPDLGVARIVAAFERAGLILFEYIEGQTLQDILSRPSESDPKHIFEKAGKWINHYTSQSHQTGPFDALGNVERILNGVTLTDPAAVEYAQQLRTHAQNVHFCSARRSHVHGDFTAKNILWDGKRLTAIDQSDRWWTAIARDVAQFLFSTMVRHRKSDSYGDIVRLSKTFRMATGLEQEEWTTVLPIFVARERLRCWAELPNLDDHPFSKSELPLFL